MTIELDIRELEKFLNEKAVKLLTEAGADLGVMSFVLNEALSALNRIKNGTREEKVSITKDQVIIDKDTLYDLLESDFRYWALENGGVDNWEGYDFSFENAVESYNADARTNFEYAEECIEDQYKKFVGEK